ncbi:MAG TPA: amidohydrolase [Bryobacteraceae bacterium]|nr:amidohydrolase [Bryobacteraceae bacterium]
MRTDRQGVSSVFFFSAFLLVNGKIWTGDPQKPTVQAVAVVNETIAAVGTDEEILKLGGGKTVVVDLLGKLVLPGFNDAHVHFLEGGQSLNGPQLRYVKSAEEFRDTLGEFAKRQPRGSWILGGEWDNEDWSKKDLPTQELIDAATNHWPVFVTRTDGDMSLANSVALEKAGINSKTKDVEGGVIVRDERGNPTGILKGEAQDLLRRVIPPATVEAIRDALRAAQTYANSHGVTSVQDMSATPEVLRAYESMLKDGELHVRVSGHQALADWKRLADVGVTANFGNPWLHIGALTGLADGSVRSGTALFQKPYSDDSKSSGTPSTELLHSKQMWGDIRDADAAGLQIAIDASGDKANHEILNLYERLAWEKGSRDRRLRIEQAEHLSVHDMDRFAALHVVASMQPYHCIDDGRWTESRVGPERAKTAFAFRSLLHKGTILAFGSDWPFEPISPLLGIYAAVTRRTLDGKHPEGWIPEQEITVEEAVRAYTIGSAFASFEDEVKGSIKPGKVADLVVLSDDIFKIDPQKIPDVKVQATIVGGRLVTGELPRRRDASGLLIR